MKAYMFINAMRGQSLALAKAIRSVPGVQGADAITGDYDILVSVQARDMGDLSTIMSGVQKIEGILKTTTCMVLAES